MTVEFVKSVQDGIRAAIAKAAEDGRTRFVCDGGWGMIFVTKSPEIFKDVVRGGATKDGEIDVRTANHLAFA